MRSQIAERSEPTQGLQLIGPIIKEPPQRGDTFGKTRSELSEAPNKSDFSCVTVSGVDLL